MIRKTLLVALFGMSVLACSKEGDTTGFPTGQNVQSATQPPPEPAKPASTAK